MRKLVKKILLIIILICLIYPKVSHAYDFASKEDEERAKRTRNEIYDLYNMHKDIVNSQETSVFGVIGYNGVCSNVTVDGGTIPLESYVAGVVKAESGAEWDNPELLKAQAIAARSFLLNTKKNASNCNVVNGESYQAYKKVDSNNTTDQKYIEAATATAGQVVVRNGEPAHTQYLSYPNAIFCREDSSGWHVNFQRFDDDPSTAWTWNGPPKQTVISANNWKSQNGAKSTSHHFGMSQQIAGYLTRVQNYTYEKVIELFYGEPIQTISDGNYTSNISYVDSTFGKVTYYNQNDYGNYYYSSNVSNHQFIGSSGKWATIASHGCGPTSAAIVASSMLNRAITPIETTQKICARGGCTSGGTYNDYLGQLLRDEYKLSVKMSNNNQEVINALGTGKSLVIVLMGPGTFTSGGHFIVLTGVNQKGQVSVADPASRARTNTKWFSFNTIVEQRKAASYTIVSR